MRIALIAVVLLPACSSPPEVGCIIPPPRMAQDDRGAALDLAAQLEGLPKGGNLAYDYDQTVRVEFDALVDSNDCLFLFLKAIECYMKEGEIGKEMAQEMAMMTRLVWATRCGLRDSALKLTTEELRFIQRSPYANSILGAWRAVGGR